MTLEVFQSSKKPVILMIGLKNDPQLEAIASHIMRQHFKVVFINSRGPLRLTVDLEKPILSGINDVYLENIRGAFIRSLPPRNRAFSGEFTENIALKDYWSGQMESDAARDTLCTLLTFLEHQPHSNVLNSPQNGLMHTHKPLQLMRAKSSGLSTPKTLLTSELREAHDFIDRFGEAVVKPVRGGSPASLIRADDTRLNSLSRSPVMLQQRIHGPDIRVFMLDGKVLSAAMICGISNRYVDFRQDPSYTKGKAVYKHVSLPKSLIEKLALLQKKEKKRFSGIDLKESESAYIFLESNAAPIYLEQEISLQDKISFKLAQALCA